MPDETAPVAERPIPCVALAEFSYSFDGRLVRELAEGDPVDVAPQHFKGLAMAGMVEPAAGIDAGEAEAAAEAALALPVQERLRRQREAEAPPPKAKRTKPSAD